MAGNIIAVIPTSHIRIKESIIVGFNAENMPDIVRNGMARADELEATWEDEWKTRIDINQAQAAIPIRGNPTESLEPRLVEVKKNELLDI